MCILSSCNYIGRLYMGSTLRPVRALRMAYLEVVFDDRCEGLGAGLANGVVAQLERGQVLVALQRFRQRRDALWPDVVAADVQALQAGVAPERGCNLRRSR